MDLFILSFLSFLLSFVLVIIFSEAITKRIEFLLLSGRASSRSKKISIYKDSLSVLGLVGVFVSSIILLLLGLVSLIVIVKVVLFFSFLIFIANELSHKKIQITMAISFRLLCAFLFVAIFNLTIPALNFINEYISASFLVFLCIQVISMINTLERTVISIAIGLSLFGTIVGVSQDNTELVCSNISVLGSLVALSYHNFNKKSIIKLGFVGEIFIGLFVGNVLFYFINNNSQEFIYNRYLPLAAVVFVYPAFDMLQLFCIKLINKIFKKNIPELQIHKIGSKK